jgi:pimeloyl-ACP methyl ester carboxylesterase
MKLDITDRLASIDLPTLVIAGEDDESTPLAANEAIHQAIAGSEFLAVPNAKHFVNIEQSNVVNDALSRFLADQINGKAQVAE